MAMFFEDRVATYPNRYKVTPINGGDPYYVTLERADEPKVVGTPMNAETFNTLVDALNEVATAEGVKTLNGGTLKFFFGTEVEYNTLSDEEKNGVFAIVTDDKDGPTYPLMVSQELYEGYAVEFNGLSAGIYFVVLRRPVNFWGDDSFVEYSGVGYIGNEDGGQYQISLGHINTSGSVYKELDFIATYRASDDYHAITLLSMDDDIRSALNKEGAIMKFYKMGGI